MVQCKCLTAKGERCKNSAKGSSQFCGVHVNCKKVYQDGIAVTASAVVKVPKLAIFNQVKRDLTAEEADIIRNKINSLPLPTKNRVMDTLFQIWAPSELLGEKTKMEVWDTLESLPNIKALSKEIAEPLKYSWTYKYKPEYWVEHINSLVEEDLPEIRDKTIAKKSQQSSDAAKVSDKLSKLGIRDLTAKEATTIRKELNNISKSDKQFILNALYEIWAPSQIILSEQMKAPLLELLQELPNIQSLAEELTSQYLTSWRISYAPKYWVDHVKDLTEEFPNIFEGNAKMGSTSNSNKPAKVTLIKPIKTVEEKCVTNGEGLQILESIPLTMDTMESMNDVYMLDEEGNEVPLSIEELATPIANCKSVKVDFIAVGGEGMITKTVKASRGVVTVGDLLEAFVYNNIKIKNDARIDQDIDDPDEEPMLGDNVHFDGIREIAPGHYDMSHFS